ncbi:hypothetical protein IW262DRAFT_1359122 [Armillaria fumosa]|nr:hypothetical protein IW262DRAFT_1359122 [Armillaria fumosa]
MLREKALFSFFLSTTGTISQIFTARPVDPSARLYDGTLSLIPPFTDLGFDHFITGHHLGSADAIMLSDVTKVKHLIRMARPLWGGRYEYGSTSRQSKVRLMMPKFLFALLNGWLSISLPPRMQLWFRSKTLFRTTCAFG